VEFVCQHVDKEALYQNSPEALFSILHVIMERNSIYLGHKYQELYASLQDRLLPPEQALDELNDSNSFLSIAINSAVKDLEHSEVDPDWLFGATEQPGDAPQYPPPRQEMLQQPHLQGGGLSGPPPQLLPGPPPPPSTQIHAGPSHRYRETPLDFEIVEQVINEQQMREQERGKKDTAALPPPSTTMPLSTPSPSSSASATKRYDPKFRALTEVFRQVSDDGVEDSMGMSHSKYGHDAVGLPDPSPTKVADAQEREVAEPLIPTEVTSPESPPEDPSVGHADRMASPSPLAHYGRNKTPSPPTIEAAGTHSPPLATEEPVSFTPPVVESAKHGEDYFQFAMPKPPRMPLKKSAPSIVLRVSRNVPLKQDEGEAIAETSSKKAAGTEDDQVAKPAQKEHVKKAKLLAEHRNRTSHEEQFAKAANMANQEEEESTKEGSAGSTREVRPIRCPHCAFNTVHPAKMRVHMKKHEGGELPRLQCRLCDFSSSWRKEMGLHLRKKHFKGGPPFSCDHAGCAFKSARMHNLLMHR